ncbi:MAG: hypothetical protein KBD29_02190 [Candidatus Magasanikbacteria bacterium]|nr:hypothetical protein [Candidatus Magasanikbacteria bacterium]
MSLKEIHRKNQILRLNKVIKLAGVRYTPKLNVEVNIASIFDGLGRTKKFYLELKKPCYKISKNLKSVRRIVSTITGQKFEKVEKNLTELITLVISISDIDFNKINFNKIYSLCDLSIKNVQSCRNLLRKLQNDHINNSRTGDKYKDEIYRDEINTLYKITSNLEDLMNFSKSSIAKAANNPRILLKGKAGTGKTHFLCDLSSNRLKNSLPTFTFLGEEFNKSTNPFSTIKGLLELSIKDNELLESINTYAENQKVRALIIIDAINTEEISCDT